MLALGFGLSSIAFNIVACFRGTGLAVLILRRTQLRVSQFKSDNVLEKMLHGGCHPSRLLYRYKI
jgi:hypothetical protein